MSGTYKAVVEVRLGFDVPSDDLGNPVGETIRFTVGSDAALLIAALYDRLRESARDFVTANHVDLLQGWFLAHDLRPESKTETDLEGGETHGR